MKGAGEMAQWLGALASLAEDRVQFPAPTKRLKTVILVPGELIHSSGLCGHQALTRYTYIHTYR